MWPLMIAFGFIFILEGLCFSIFPGFLRNLMESLARLSDLSLRILGAALIVLGFLFMWISR